MGRDGRTVGQAAHSLQRWNQVFWGIHQRFGGENLGRV